MTQAETIKPVGILSHGQLGLMTAEAATNMGVPIEALGPGKNSPTSYATTVIEGDYNDPQNVLKFSERVGSFVLDTDHVKTGVLKDLSERGFLVIPNPDAIRTLQNRRLQKEALNRAGIPTAPWRPALSKQEFYNAYGQLGGDVIVKTSEGGFDGRGNMNVKNDADLDQAWQEFGGQEVVIEKKLNIRRELATMLARDTRNGRAIYPIVESIHKDGMLEYTFLPSFASKKTIERVNDLGQGVLDVIGGPGLIGLEIIETTDGEVVANEYAGRPHNTGHYTIEACATSQFENLLRIATGQSVGRAGLVRPGQMVLMHNLNGGVNFQDANESHYKIAEENGGTLHWYHKEPREQSPPRKRGHITLFGPDRDTLMKNAQAAITAMHFFN